MNDHGATRAELIEENAKLKEESKKLKERAGVPPTLAELGIKGLTAAAVKLKEAEGTLGYAKYRFFEYNLTEFLKNYPDSPNADAYKERQRQAATKYVKAVVGVETAKAAAMKAFQESKDES